MFYIINNTFYSLHLILARYFQVNNLHIDFINIYLNAYTVYFISANIILVVYSVACLYMGLRQGFPGE